MRLRLAASSRSFSAFWTFWRQLAFSYRLILQGQRYWQKAALLRFLEGAAHPSLLIILIKILQTAQLNHIECFWSRNRPESDDLLLITPLMKPFRHSIQQNMVLTSKENYSISQKIFCCKCFDCLQNDVVLTTDIRKQTLQRMIRNFTISQDEENIEDPLKLMILIYLCVDEQIPKKFIYRCQINSDRSNDSYRTDLQFYIPQLCNYLVFHNELAKDYLSEAIQKASRLSFYFAHTFYFYLVSLEKVIGTEEIQEFKMVTDYKVNFLQDMNKVYDGLMLNCIEHFLGDKIKTIPNKSDLGYLIKMYGTTDSPPNAHLLVRAQDIALPNYASIFSPFGQQEVRSFQSNINFYQDLFRASQDLKGVEDKKQKLREVFQEMNLRLPACVYVPFVKDSDEFCNILNIVVEETRIFSTKQRAPFYICLQVYHPMEVLSEPLKDRFLRKVEQPITLKHLKSEGHIGRKYSDDYYPHRVEIKEAIRPKRESIDGNPQTEVFNEKKNFLTAKLLEYSNDVETQPRLNYKKKNEMQMREINSKEMEKKFEQMFGQSDEEMKQRIRQKSIYKNLSSWKLIHLIVKTDDNLKQEQFALQLIYMFDYIFKLEKLPLLLTPYEVLSMGPDSGIIEMVRDSITFDKLKKHLKSDFGRQLSLKEFFEIYFGERLSEAKEAFMNSLAAYSLVMYFLQAKDRHNGNILLHRSGKMFHIDFGFFLSNLPGKGVELEKDCPFKLLSEYIDVLDGSHSYYFKKFREHLFQGFKAVRKHQNKILMLVKMMYSSSGMSMPCFEKGDEAIRQIELRFNPERVVTDAQLNLHCQKLINSSLDNWATKWYDRFQYFAQGIFY